MKYVRFISLIFLFICLNITAKPSFRTLYLNDVLVVSTYKFNGRNFVHKGHTIRIGSKDVPFFIRSELNIWLLDKVFSVDSLSLHDYFDHDFISHFMSDNYKKDLYLSPFERGYMDNQVFSTRFYYKHFNKKYIYVSYKFTGYVILYDIDDELPPMVHFDKYEWSIAKHGLFAILKSADSIRELMPKEEKKENLKHSGISTIWLQVGDDNIKNNFSEIS